MQRRDAPEHTLRQIGGRYVALHSYGFPRRTVYLKYLSPTPFRSYVNMIGSFVVGRGRLVAPIEVVNARLMPQRQSNNYTRNTSVSI